MYGSESEHNHESTSGADNSILIQGFTFSSMVEALPMVKQMISDLVKNAPKIPTWVLTHFKDPQVKIVKITSEAEELKSGIDSLKYGGGGDLKEQALKGIM